MARIKSIWIDINCYCSFSMAYEHSDDKRSIKNIKNNVERKRLMIYNAIYPFQLFIKILMNNIRVIS